VIWKSLITGIADAVTEYSRQRDVELQRQHNEHVGFIAHELRNPLGSATAAFDLLKLRGKIPPDARESVVLERGLKRMQELIDHSLNIARAASGVELRTERVSLRELLEELAATAVPEAEQKEIALSVRVETDAVVALDLRLVRSALTNLLRNAIKYTPVGGSVELRGSVASGRATIEVEDCCGGLPPGAVEKAFAPFVRLNTSEEGSGLGLAIAKQAVDAHGGSIRVQDLPKKGCIFALEFPAPTASS
jgi:hypothetical protein